MSANPGTKKNTLLFVGGVYQPKSSYSISGTTLTFNTAPPTGTSVEAIIGDSTNVNVPEDDTVTSAKLSGDLTTPGNLTVNGITDTTNFKVGGAQGSDGQVLTSTGSGVAWENAAAGGIASLVADTSPQLGGTLDANSNTIDMGTNVITDTKVGQWDTAYGWGDHSQANYKRYEFGAYDSDWAQSEVDETFVVTYGQIPSADNYREYGSSANYVVLINGLAKPTLHLKPRGIYKFDLSSPTLSGRFF